ncbi:hypothetical protein ACIQUG_22405 [Ensifer sp. NPDC090286]|uniref:hypothetical protein n=1 Tax=Ensifer sp. NPDC090286 TaxID=3363991 RepID=UPI00383AD0CB
MLKNMMLLLISLTVALGVGEAMLRMFTPFPIGTRTHKSIDEKYGYRLDPALGDVDKDGFRDPSGLSHDFQVAAVGDSMTYGNNVDSAHSWPAAFAAMTGERTYNFGVGSYGIYTYHAIVHDALAAGAKGNIVAVFPANDFAVVFSACDIMKARSDFWLSEQKRLHLKALFGDARGYSMCGEEQSESLKTKLVENVAILSAYHHEIAERLKSLYAQLFKQGDGETSEYYTFPDGCPSVLKRYVDDHGRMADLASPETAAMFGDFQRFAADWAQQRPGRVGILLIPSKERVIFEWLRRHDRLASAAPEFVLSVERQVALEDKIRQTAEEFGLPYHSALAATTDALQEAILAGHRLYPERDGHPFEAGYSAFARTASLLWDEMTVRAAQAGD